jgi:hypothetical protein
LENGINDLSYEILRNKFPGDAGFYQSSEDGVSWATKKNKKIGLR